MEQQRVLFSITVETREAWVGVTYSWFKMIIRAQDILVIASCFSQGSFFVVEDSEGSRVMSKVGLVLVTWGILVGCDPETK